MKLLEGVVAASLVVGLNTAEAREVGAVASEHPSVVQVATPATHEVHVFTATHSTDHGQEWSVLGIYRS